MRHPCLDVPQFLVPTDEVASSRPAFVRRDIDVDEPPCRHTTALPLELERWDGHTDPEIPDQLTRHRADEDLPCSGSLLETSCGVDRVARDAGLTGPEPACEHDARVDTDPDREANPPFALEVGVQDLDAGNQVERRTACPVGVVLVRGRYPEDTEHRVADDLLDRPAMPMERRLAGRVVAELHLTKNLRVESLAEGSGPYEVAEEHRHELADRGGRVGLEPCPTLRAELRSGRIHRPALGAAAPCPAQSLAAVRVTRRSFVHEPSIPPGDSDLGAERPLLGLKQGIASTRRGRSREWSRARCSRSTRRHYPVRGTCVP